MPGRQLKEEALARPDITLNDLIQLGRTKQSVANQLLEMTKRTVNQVEQHHHRRSDSRIRSEYGRSRPDTTRSRASEQPAQRRHHEREDDQSHERCYNCGGDFPHLKDRPCPAKGKQCRKCEKLNHFAAQCRSKPAHPNRPQASSSRRVRQVHDANEAKAAYESYDEDSNVWQVTRRAVNRVMNLFMPFVLLMPVLSLCSH
jgi:hypothetical protein